MDLAAEENMIEGEIVVVCAVNKIVDGHEELEGNFEVASD